MIDLEAFGKFLDTAQAGERLTYHRGRLAYDRADRGGVSDADRDAAREINKVANAIWEAAQAGQVVLTQHRVDPSACEYFVTRANGKDTSR